MYLRQKLVAGVWRANSFALRRVGPGFPIVIVNEHPKSGGTWIAKMLSAALDLPFIEGGLFIPSLPCVIRTHWKAHKNYDPFVYVLRDCRDVMISLFHHRIKNQPRTPDLNKRYRHRLGEDLDASKIREQLTGFIEVEFESNLPGSRLNWDKHVNAGLNVAELTDSARRCSVRYEDVLKSPVDEIDGIIAKLFELEISRDKLDLVEALHNKKFGRERLDTASDSTFVRKAVAGEWREVFSRESGRTLSDYVGDALLKTGYETDENWWTSLPS